MNDTAAVAALTADVAFSHGPHPIYRLRPLASPMFDAKTGASCSHFDVIPGKLYTLGRSKSTCDLIFQDRRVSRRHCTIFLDPKNFSLYIYDGTTKSDNEEHLLVSEIEPYSKGFVDYASEKEQYTKKVYDHDATIRSEGCSKGRGVLTTVLHPSRTDLRIDADHVDGSQEYQRNGTVNNILLQRKVSCYSMASNKCTDDAIVGARTANFVKSGSVCRFLLAGKSSLNGIYVNGHRLGVGSFQVLHEGSEVSLVECSKGAHSLNPSFGEPVGFIVSKFANTSKCLDHCCNHERNSGDIGGSRQKPKFSASIRQKKGISTSFSLAVSDNYATSENENNGLSAFRQSLMEDQIFDLDEDSLVKHMQTPVGEKKNSTNIENQSLCGSKYLKSTQVRPLSKGSILLKKSRSRKFSKRPSSLIKSAEKLIKASQTLRTSISSSWDVNAAGTCLETSEKFEPFERFYNQIKQCKDISKEDSSTIIASRSIPVTLSLQKSCFQYSPQIRNHVTDKEVPALRLRSIADCVPETKCYNHPFELQNNFIHEDTYAQKSSGHSEHKYVDPHDTFLLKSRNFSPTFVCDGLENPHLAVYPSRKSLQSTATEHKANALTLTRHSICSGSTNLTLEAARSTESIVASTEAGRREVPPEPCVNFENEFKIVLETRILGRTNHSNQNFVQKSLPVLEQSWFTSNSLDLRASKLHRTDMAGFKSIFFRSTIFSSVTFPLLPILAQRVSEGFFNVLPDGGLQKQNQFLPLVLSRTGFELKKRSLSGAPNIIRQFPWNKNCLRGLVSFAEDNCSAHEYSVKYCSNICQRGIPQSDLTFCEGLSVKLSKSEASTKLLLPKSSAFRYYCTGGEKKSAIEKAIEIGAAILSSSSVNGVQHVENFNIAKILVNGKRRKVMAGIFDGLNVARDTLRPNKNTQNFPLSTLYEDDRRVMTSRIVVKAKDSLTARAINTTTHPVECSYIDHDDLNLGSNICSVKYGPGLHGFCLNKLEWMDYSQSCCSSVSLKELLMPLDDLQAILLSTFTCDIQWFMRSHNISRDLPVTVCCHDSERCWSSSITSRSSIPFLEWPNLRIVYPLFPDVCSFKGEQKRRGIGCHHPKLFLLKRQKNLRVIITSANLNARQWLHISNTVWWQDFPRQDVPNFQALFRFSDGQLKDPINANVTGDFAAQLASFVASLLVDVREEAKWVVDLALYDFSSASASLVASIPGLYSRRVHSHADDAQIGDFCSKQSHCSKQSGRPSEFLGFVDSIVVGITHRFSPEADPNGSRLRALAATSSKGNVDADGMIQVILKRGKSVSIDPNAVSVLVPLLEASNQDLVLEKGAQFHGSSPSSFSQEMYVHLGFLPKSTAKWVAVLCDSGIINFKAKLSLREAFLAASSQSKRNVQLILYVFHGEEFLHLSGFISSAEHVVALSSLLHSLHHSVGVWRLQEVLSSYDWPNSEETDFNYCSSSMGVSLDAPFFANFSSAVGRRAFSSAGSTESDPEWGCWTAAHEAENPSIGLVFPTIERAKHGRGGLASHRGLLSFAESTWERLKDAQLLHDAVPHPAEREGVAMHVKVARRRFRNSSGTAYGWVYCGSHNFSPAAWGKCISKSSFREADTSATNDMYLHVYNYELGLVFIEPPPELKTTDGLPKNTSHHFKTSHTKGIGNIKKDLDRFVMPFVVPPPKYRFLDHPATGKALYTALYDVDVKNDPKLNEIDTELLGMDAPMNGDLEQERQLSLVDHHAPSKGEENYAEALFIQLDSIDSL